MDWDWDWDGDGDGDGGGDGDEDGIDGNENGQALRSILARLLLSVLTTT